MQLDKSLGGITIQKEGELPICRWYVYVPEKPNIINDKGYLRRQFNMINRIVKCNIDLNSLRINK